jgi:putative intracellular protease/amidase
LAVYVFLHDGYADWELGYILPELRTPAALPQVTKRTRRVVTFGLAGAPVESIGGLSVTPQVRLDDVPLDDIEALIVPGGTFWVELEHRPLDALVRAVAARGRVVGGICAATAYLAQLGLLDEVMHTSNSLAFLKERAPGYRGEQGYREELAVSDCNIVTASGLGAVDFTHKLLRALEVYPPDVCDIWYRAFKHGEDPFATGS